LQRRCASHYRCRHSREWRRVFDIVISADYPRR
jgi:hypothetical protein